MTYFKPMPMNKIYNEVYCNISPQKSQIQYNQRPSQQMDTVVQGSSIILYRGQRPDNFPDILIFLIKIVSFESI